MNPKLTELVVILDKSGSMHSVVSDTIGGFNALLEEQKKGVGDIKVTLALFDDHYKLLHNGVVIADVPKLDENTYKPSGSTALLDAIGRTVDEVGARLAKTPEEERPSKVIVAIITDGEENCSREYNKTKIAEKIKHQTDKYAWQFLFLGANQDAFAEAGNIGIAQAFACNYNATCTRGVVKAVSAYTFAARAGAASADISSLYKAEEAKGSN